MTDRDWRPRYLQVAEDLREQIERGDIKPGEPLPSEAELVTTFRLSRTSVRNSIRQLREWGLVRAEQGRGTYVRGAKARVQRNSPERYRWEKERAQLDEAERRATGGTELDTGLSTDDLQFHSQYAVI